MDWEERFRANDAPWERRELHPAFAHWTDLGLLKPGARIIVPGCGRAPEPLELARAGLDVTLADLSDTALTWQEDAFRTAGLTMTRIDGDALAFTPDQAFDLVWEQTFLCAISPKLRPQYEDTVHRWLKPGGTLLALFMQKDEMGGPPYGCPLDAMHTLLPDTRWDWSAEPTQTAFPHPHLNDKAELAIPLVRR